MKLNRVETLIMNNPIRALIQMYYEAPRMAGLVGKLPNSPNTLVIGCGRGVDIDAAFKIFKAARVTAIDIDPAQVARAKERVGEKYGDRLRLLVDDAEKTSFADGEFELVLDFGIIHHIPRWQKAVDEIFRLTAPGGLFIFEEVPGRKLNSRPYRTFLDHPRENRFSAEDFGRQCERSGFEIIAPVKPFFGFFRGAAAKKR